MLLDLTLLPGRRIGQRWGATRAPIQGLHRGVGGAEVLPHLPPCLSLPCSPNAINPSGDLDIKDSCYEAFVFGSAPSAGGIS